MKFHLMYVSAVRNISHLCNVHVISSSLPLFSFLLIILLFFLTLPSSSQPPYPLPPSLSLYLYTSSSSPLLPPSFSLPPLHIPTLIPFSFPLPAFSLPYIQDTTAQSKTLEESKDTVIPVPESGEDVIRIKRLSTLVTNIIRNTGTWGGAVPDGKVSRWGQETVKRKSLTDAAFRHANLNKLETEQTMRLGKGRHALPDVQYLHGHIVLIQGTYVLYYTVLTIRLLPTFIYFDLFDLLIFSFFVN